MPRMMKLIPEGYLGALYQSPVRFRGKHRAPPK